jgi:hypothetical protein
MVNLILSQHSNLFSLAYVANATAIVNTANPSLPISSITVPFTGTALFYVRPVRALPPGEYSATIVVSGANVASRSFGVRFFVRQVGISLTNHETEQPFCEDLGTFTHTFLPMAEAGINYVVPTALTARATNIGNMPTGALTVSLGGLHPSAFQLSQPPTIPNLQNNGDWGTFTVRPIAGLPGGTYTARVTVRGVDNIIAPEFFEVLFRVRFYDIDLHPKEHVFRPATEGYTNPPSLTATVTNTGNWETEVLTISVSNNNFIIVESLTIPSIPDGGFAEFTVRPAMHLLDGTYTATIEVRGARVPTRSFQVSFSVGSMGMAVNQGPHTFQLKRLGYNHPIAQQPVSLEFIIPSPLIIVITNTGTLPTGEISITFDRSSKSPNAFRITETRLLSIAGKDETASFTVQPVTGLAPGLYTATIIVRAENIDEFHSFDVSFSVFKYGCDCTPASRPFNYDILFILICLAALAALLWVGIRKLPQKQPTAKQKKRKEDNDHLANLLLLANPGQSAHAATQGYIQPQAHPYSQPRQRRATQKPTPPPPVSITDQLLSAAMATVTKAKAQSAKSTTPTASPAQESSTASSSAQPSHDKTAQTTKEAAAESSQTSPTKQKAAAPTTIPGHPSQ